MAEARRRLFLALWPGEAVAGALDAAGLEAQRLCGGRRMRRDTLHLTLVFLGDVEASRIPGLVEALGAAGLGDIGRHFPDTDPRFEGADSRVLLREAAAAARAAGWQTVNVDATVIARAPRILPFVPAMVANIAADLGVDPAAVNIKGKTTEKLGFTGRGEGIAAQAVALLARADG